MFDYRTNLTLKLWPQQLLIMREKVCVGTFKVKKITQEETRLDQCFEDFAPELVVDDLETMKLKKCMLKSIESQ